MKKDPAKNTTADYLNKSFNEAISKDANFKFCDNDTVVAKNTPSNYHEQQGVLILNDNTNQAKSFTINHSPFYIGRNEKCDATIKDLNTSRVHGKITANIESKKYIIEDLNSTAGIYINGQKIKQKSYLSHGDVVLLGKSQMRFYLKKVKTENKDQTNTKLPNNSSQDKASNQQRYISHKKYYLLLASILIFATIYFSQQYDLFSNLKSNPDTKLLADKFNKLLLSNKQIKAKNIASKIINMPINDEKSAQLKNKAQNFLLDYDYLAKAKHFYQTELYQQSYLEVKKINSNSLLAQEKNNLLKKVQLAQEKILLHSANSLISQNKYADANAAIKTFLQQYPTSKKVLVFDKSLQREINKVQTKADLAKNIYPLFAMGKINEVKQALKNKNLKDATLVNKYQQQLNIFEKNISLAKQALVNKDAILAVNYLQTTYKLLPQLAGKNKGKLNSSISKDYCSALYLLGMESIFDDDKCKAKKSFIKARQIYAHNQHVNKQIKLLQGIKCSN